MGMQQKPFFHFYKYTQVPVTERNITGSDAIKDQEYIKWSKEVDEQMDMTTSIVYKYTTCTNEVNK
jgi:hypothetical protein